MAVYSMLCTDGLLLHLVGKGQLLVYSGASYSNGKLGDSIWESHHKSSARACARCTQGARKANIPPVTRSLVYGVCGRRRLQGTHKNCQRPTCAYCT